MSQIDPDAKDFSRREVARLVGHQATLGAGIGCLAAVITFVVGLVIGRVT